MPQKKLHKRLLLKISGEMIMGSQQFGVDNEACKKAALAIQGIKNCGLEVAVVIGGGNIFRGVNLNKEGMERTAADQIGMLATLINGITLQEALTSIGCEAVVMSALECPRVAENYNWHRAHQHLKKGTILIFVGGTGSPYFTTDTAAALRANEIHADILLKATKVDGIYNKDPLKYADATKYDQITYKQALSEKLEVMDATAFSLCMANNLPIFVFNMERLNHYKITEILADKIHGTLVTENDSNEHR